MHSGCIYILRTFNKIYYFLYFLDGITPLESDRTVTNENNCEATELHKKRGAAERPSASTEGGAASKYFAMKRRQQAVFITQSLP